MPDPDPLYVSYDQYTAAVMWSRFAAHALAGSLAHESTRPISANAESEARVAAAMADAMLAEFRSRFHHRPGAKS